MTAAPTQTVNVNVIRPGPQYDAGAASVTEKSFFHQSNCIPDVKFFDNLIGWMLANAHDATLVRASYCEPGLMVMRF